MNYMHPYFRIINESGMRQVSGVSFSIVVMKKTTFSLHLCGNKLNFSATAVMHEAQYVYICVYISMYICMYI